MKKYPILWRLIKVTTTRRSGVIIVPRAYTPNWDITVNGLNVDTELTEIDINRMVNEGTGNFSMTLLNPNLFQFSGMEELIVNADFGSASTVLFRGTVEEVKPGLRDTTTIKLAGRHVSGELADLHVTENFQDMELADMIRTLATNYATVPNVRTSYTVTNVTDTNITDSISFDQTPFFEAIREICYRADFDFYIDNDRGFHFFKAGSIRNMTDAIGPTWFQNSEGLGDSVVEIKNRIIMHGTTPSGLPIITQVNDANSQALYGIREKFISDTRITTVKIAEMLGNAFLLFNKNKVKIGTVTSLGLPTLLPGDKIYIEEHTVGISGQFRISHINDKIGDNGWYTTVTAERIGSVRFSAIFRDLASGKSTVDFKNPNKMKYSVVDDFDNSDQIESSANATISNGDFRQTSLGSNGQITSTIKAMPEDVSQCELRIAGQDLNSSVFAVNTDGGTTTVYTIITPNQLTSIPSGKDIKVRITLVDNSTNVLPILDGYSLLLR